MNQTCVDILTLVADAALSSAEIYARMLARYRIDEDAELREAIDDVTALLDQLGVLSSTR